MSRWEMCRKSYADCGHDRHRPARHPLPGRGEDGNPLTVEGRRPWRTWLRLR